MKGLIIDDTLESGTFDTLREVAQEDCAEGSAVKPKLNQYYPQNHPRRESTEIPVKE